MIDFVMHRAMYQRGFGIPSCRSGRLTDFADYIVPFGVTKNIIRTMTERLERKAAKIGFHITANKMKIGNVDESNNASPWTTPNRGS